MTAESSCGACDICCPDLVFDPARAPRVESTDAEELEEVTRRLPEAFRQFDPVEVDKLVNIAAHHHALLSLQGQAEQRLVVDPYNLSALAIAGMCAQRRGFSDQAALHFVSGLSSVEHGARDVDTATFFYEHLRELDEPRALSLLQRRGGVFDNPEGHEYAARELERAAADGLADSSSAEVAQWHRVADAWDQTVGPAVRELGAALAQTRQSLKETRRNE